MVVEPSDAKNYEGHGYNLLVKETEGKIMDCRNWILDYCETNGISKVVMLDDDIGFQKRRIDAPGRFIYTLTEEDILQLFVNVYNNLDKYAHVYVAHRFMAQYLPPLKQPSSRLVGSTPITWTS